MRTPVKKRLLDALNACRAIESFTAHRPFAEFEQNLMLRSAVERQFEIVGEALNQAQGVAQERMFGKSQPFFQGWFLFSPSCHWLKPVATGRRALLREEPR